MGAPLWSKIDGVWVNQETGARNFAYETGGAHYKCCRCRFEFEGDPGPQTIYPGTSTPVPNVCWECGSPYVRWTNYQEQN